jgi:hypothetical protein
LFKIFLWLDIVILLFAGLSAVAFAEQSAAMAAERIVQLGEPDARGSGWLELSGLRVLQLDEKPGGIAAPEFLRYLLPQKTSEGVRRIYLESAAEGASQSRIERLVYQVSFDYQGKIFGIIFRLGSFLRIFQTAFLGLLLIELLVVLSSITKD